MKTNSNSAIHAAQHHSEGKTMALVRVPKEDEWALTTALDAGAAGIIIPHSESKEEVEEFMKKIYYRKCLYNEQRISKSHVSLPHLNYQAPLGNRSFSPWVFTPGISDASLYADDAFNIKTANNHIAVIPQIESVKGIANVEEIASIPGVSALMFGPGDFMADAGVPLSLGEPHPTLVSAMQSMSKASKKFDKPLWG
jgi:4-hydroxy-2-oxoheptanedioate aldolase